MFSWVIASPVSSPATRPSHNTAIRLESRSNSGISLVNEQKYYASTDGSYVDQDVHRISPSLSVTIVDRTTGKFQSRSELAAPMGMGTSMGWMG